MQDDDAVYIFANGDEYRGAFSASKKRKKEHVHGCFEGLGSLRIHGYGTFIGQFKYGEAVGTGKVETLGGTVIDIPNELNGASHVELRKIVETICKHSSEDKKVTLN